MIPEFSVVNGIRLGIGKLEPQAQLHRFIQCFAIHLELALTISTVGPATYNAVAWFAASGCFY